MVLKQITQRICLRDEKKPAASADGGKTEAAPTEDSFLLDKAIRCTVCDKVFKTK